MLLIESGANYVRQAPTQAVQLRCEPLEDRTVPSFLAPVASPGVFNGIGDFNGDGRADLVVADYDADTVAIRLGNGDGTFQPVGLAQVVPFLYGQTVVADFTGDGEVDVLTNGNGVNLLRGIGDGTLHPPVLTSIPGNATQILVGDMNNDGRPDAVRRWFTFTPTYNHYEYRVSILLAQADGTFVVSQSLNVGFSHTDHGQTTKQIPPRSVHVGDFDGDGRRDLMTVAANGSNDAFPSKLFWGNGDSTVTFSGPNVTQFVGVSVSVADLNQDGKADVIRADSNLTTSTVFLGQGNGQFTRTQRVPIAGTPVVADINHDRHPDAVSVNSTNGVVKVLLGNGDGKFKPAQDFATVLTPTAIAVDDFDGDGWLDVIAGGGGRLSVLLNDRIW